MLVQHINNLDTKLVIAFFW